MDYLRRRRPQRIAVFRALQLGDLLCTMPAIRALRATLPDARIALVGLPSMESFANRYTRYIDDFIAFPGLAGFPEQPEQPALLPGFIADMQRQRFDLAIQMQGDGTLANDLVRSFGADASAGFYGPTACDGDLSLFVPWDDDASEVRRGLVLMEHLGADADAVADTSLELPIDDLERRQWKTLKSEHALDGAPIVVIHPGARWSSRRWPIDRYAAVAVALAARGARIVVTGSADERDLVDTLVALLKERDVHPVDLAGRTSLGALGALLQDTRLLVCNDTGISHVAAALRTPSVVIASGSNVARWAPLDSRRHRVLAYDVPCRPCGYRDCPIDHPCAKGVGVDDVIAAAMAHDLKIPPEAVRAA